MSHVKKFILWFQELSQYLIQDKVVKETLFIKEKWKYNVYKYINFILSFIIFIPIVISLIEMNIPHFINFSVCAFGIYLTWIFERVTKSTIFKEMKTYTIVQISLHSFFGSWLEFYDRFEYFDDILHISGGIWFSFIIFPIILGSELAYSRSKIPSLLWKVNIFTFSLSVTFGVFWEILEFTSDQIFQNYPGYRLTQEGSLIDTMGDLIFDCVGAVLGIMLFWAIINQLNKNRDMKIYW